MTDLQRVFALVGAILLVLLIHNLQPILSPFLVGALLAYLGDPLADRLERLKPLNRTLAVCVVFLIFSLLLLLMLLITLPMVGRQLDLLMSKLPIWVTGLQEVLLPWLQARFDLPQESLDISTLTGMIGSNWQTAGGVLSHIWQRLAGSGVAMAAGVANLVLIPVVSFYLLRDWDILMAKIQDLLPRSWEATIVSLSKECDEILGAFIRGQFVVMLSLSVIYSVGLMMVGLELALLLGLLAGLASVVPYLGFIVGITAAGIAAYFQFHEWQSLMGVAAVFSVGQLLESMVLTPMLVGDRIGLHPVAVIFAIMAGGQLAGFVGVLLALPVAAVIMVWLRHLHRNYKVSELYTASDDS